MGSGCAVGLGVIGDGHLGIPNRYLYLSGFGIALIAVVENYAVFLN